ncbi:MAG: sigma 54-interacting transcriptional regulator [Candidatus Eisenbacteria bacterium]|nr:sigma 54-interacting transcriptional regulator [Candidatus Eisenbacteria bacterium]
MRTQIEPALGARLDEVEFLLQRSSKSLSNVLIMGENKAVRLVIAFSFHSRGRTSRLPFLATDCKNFLGELKEKLIDGLDGKDRNAGHVSPVTWGVSGTTFLDEADEISVSEQKLFLEFVKERERQKFLSVHSPIGRLVIGSGKNLEDLCRWGKFLPELYDCLNKVKVNLASTPTLRLVE